MRKQTYEVCFSRNTVIYETPEFPADRYSGLFSDTDSYAVFCCGTERLCGITLVVYRDTAFSDTLCLQCLSAIPCAFSASATASARSLDKRSLIRALPVCLSA